MLRYTTDRARPGLVALYDIWPGNRGGQFLQPRNPHGATTGMTWSLKDLPKNLCRLAALHITEARVSLALKGFKNKQNITQTDATLR